LLAIAPFLSNLTKSRCSRSNGTPQRFRGSYKLRRVNNVPGSTPKQRRWYIYSANISLEQ
ncbi:hypothetical protein, partial [uncultured Nostoc sp.]|uniref:hypothetical protein n=1 Tax=uncultured Nostoc sp. TaxID=340711 RepID=UPI00260871EC